MTYVLSDFDLSSLLPETGPTDYTSNVIAGVINERLRQDEKWGEQHHVDVAFPQREDDFFSYASTADYWKEENDIRVRMGHIAWDGILLEEVYEALAEEDSAKLRAELVQVAAVAIAWCEDIDSRVRVENVSD